MTKQSEPKVLAPAPSLQKRFYGLRDAAHYLGVSEQFLYQRTCRRTQMPLAIPFRRLGGKILFDIRDLEKF